MFIVTYSRYSEIIILGDIIVHYLQWFTFSFQYTTGEVIYDFPFQYNIGSSDQLMQVSYFGSSSLSQ